MILRESAYKHGISSDDAIYAATVGCAFIAALDEEHPGRELRLGFDKSTRLLEIVVLKWDDGTEEIIHAMKARKKYQSLIS